MISHAIVVHKGFRRFSMVGVGGRLSFSPSSRGDHVGTWASPAAGLQVGGLNIGVHETSTNTIGTPGARPRTLPAAISPVADEAQRAHPFGVDAADPVDRLP